MQQQQWFSGTEFRGRLEQSFSLAHREQCVISHDSGRFPSHLAAFFGWILLQ